MHSSSIKHLVYLFCKLFTETLFNMKTSKNYNFKTEQGVIDFMESLDFVKYGSEKYGYKWRIEHPNPLYNVRDLGYADYTPCKYSRGWGLNEWSMTLLRNRRVQNNRLNLNGEI